MLKTLSIFCKKAPISYPFFLQTRFNSTQFLLSDREYRKFELIGKKPVNYNTHIFSFKLDLEKNIPLGKHVSLRAIIDGAHIVRPYTPITPRGVKGSIDILMKVYPNGKMSSYVNSLKIGDTIEAMGPIGSIQFPPKTYKSIGMIAGGTGITPFYQIIQEVLHDPDDPCVMTLLYANNEERDILLHSDLMQLHRRYPKFRYHCVLAKPPPNSKNVFEEGFITTELIKKYLNTESIIMVCGPPKMEEIVLSSLDSLGVSKNNQVAFTNSATHIHDAAVLKSFHAAHKEYTLEEVSRHNKENDCWLIIENNVYDATSFVDKHPGGYIILDGAGKDATSLFNDDFPHSTDAKDELKPLQIGVLKK